MSSKNWIVRLAAAAGCVSMVSTALAWEPPRVEMRRLVIRREAPPQTRYVKDQDEPREEGRAEPRRGSHWIGLECFPVEPALRSHLGLAEGEGLIIEHVVPDSPAAKAELKQHDVIVQAGEKRIKSVMDLAQAVDEARESELSLEVIRAGKLMSVEVTPARRPQRQDFLQHMPERRFEAFRGLLEQMQRGEQPGRYRFFGPGAILPGSDKGLPKDLSVSITRSGSEPARIVVKKGDETWEITEEELDKLPDEIRPHVQRMLGRGVLELPPHTGPGLPPPGRPGLPRFERRADEQLKEMMEQMDKLRRQMEELKKSLLQQEPAADETRT